MPSLKSLLRNVNISGTRGQVSPSRPNFTFPDQQNLIKSCVQILNLSCKGFKLVYPAHSEKRSAYIKEDATTPVVRILVPKSPDVIFIII